MSRSRFACLIMLVAGLSGTWLEARPKPRAVRRDSGADEVKLVLQREQNAPIDRRAELQDVLKRQPDLAEARWQSGYVDVGGAWQSYAARPKAVLLANLERYRQEREAVGTTVRDQLSLAVWCKREGLRDQERAHRLAAVKIANPVEQQPIFESLGYRQAGGQWLSPQEVNDWERQSRAADESLKSWGRQVERLAAQVQGNGGHRARARAALLEIQDPAAVSALEWHLATQSISGALLLVEILDQMPAYEGSVSLAKLAVFSQWAEVRKSATKALCGRKLEDFAPSLIELLSTPAESRVSVSTIRGQLFYSYVAMSETNEHYQLARTVFVPAPKLTIIVQGLSDQREASRRESAANSERFAAEQIHERERLREAHNEAVAELNSRIGDVLCEVSGGQRYTQPREWWDWWASAADVRSDAKRVVVSEDDVVQQPGVEISVEIHHSCFQAGTPVWTETGPVPIDQIRIGDRVLSQNAETGELAYKPVLHKSLGPKRQLIRVTAGDETLVCTYGHRFWVAGEAWIMARELSPKKLLHTATRSIPVESVSEGPEDETHNLVVADFHSYFVGKQAFLVQDLPLPRSTNCVVPGLQPEW